MSEPERRTSVSIYESDLAFLKRHQLSVSGKRGEWIPMFDILHELISRVSAAEADGIVMTPMIVDLAKFQRRTEQLRATGFTEEADARDVFASRTPRSEG